MNVLAVTFYTSMRMRMYLWGHGSLVLMWSISMIGGCAVAPRVCNNLLVHLYIVHTSTIRQSPLVSLLFSKFACRSQLLRDKMLKFISNMIWSDSVFIISKSSYILLWKHLQSWFTALAYRGKCQLIELVVNLACICKFPCQSWVSLTSFFMFLLMDRL